MKIWKFGVSFLRRSCLTAPPSPHVPQLEKGAGKKKKKVPLLLNYLVTLQALTRREISSNSSPAQYVVKYKTSAESI